MGTAQEWREKSREVAIAEAQPLELPSGMTIMARRPGPAMAAAYGRLPLTLANVITGGGSPMGGVEPSPDVTLAGFLHGLLLHCVVSPTISLRPGPDTIHPADISNDDVDYIIGWALRREEAGSLETFRKRRNDAALGRDGEGIPLSTQ